MQYPESLPLSDHEVVLTFDDAPVPLYTNRVLEALESECVKATFFIVGQQARAYPAEVRKIYNAGHTIATHSQTHPLIFTRLPIGGAQREIEQGIASVTAALGDPRAVAPFFRFPGLGRSRAFEAYLASRRIMVWSADFVADDWTHISADEVMKRALERLERDGRGILLLHDIQPATALMLPRLLRALKERNYHVVHVVPAGLGQPKTVTEPASWVLRKPRPTVWPMILNRAAVTLPVPSFQSFGWPRPFRADLVAPMPVPPALVLGSSRAPLKLDPQPTAEPPTLQPVAPIVTFEGIAEVSGELLPWNSPDELRPLLVAPDVILSSVIGPGTSSTQFIRPHTALQTRRTAAHTGPAPLVGGWSPQCHVIPICQLPADHHR
ncbi:MAG TPA: polysaccharide deacetylase family protein [Xanthobacteraceae bacterium]|nr:polysaccharide deacetylase family protein [Xanthobacteraceae bacterium]